MSDVVLGVSNAPAGGNARRRRTLSIAARTVGLFAFTWVLLDSLINYFLETLTGVSLPVTAVLPLFLIAIVFKWGLRAIVPPAQITFALAFGALGFLLGPLLVDEISFYRYVELVGAFCAFAIGYVALRWANNEVPVVRVLLLVVGAYVVVCIIALQEIVPSIFPIVSQAWTYWDVVVMRPEVMTDQNFQVFYLFPAALVLALPYRFLQFLFGIALVVGGLYILTKLQTRSGVLVLVATVVMALAAPIWNASLGRKKLIPLILFFGAFVAISFQFILSEGGLLLARLADTEYETGYGRLTSTLYLLEHVYYPHWWVPQGYEDFIKKFGIIPHSNATAMYLEGGIAGLYMWITIFLLPPLLLLKPFLRGKLDALSTLILLGSASMLVVQLSLNVPFFKQPWLWAGAVVGTLCRVREGTALEHQLGTSQPSKAFIMDHR